MQPSEDHLNVQPAATRSVWSLARWLIPLSGVWAIFSSLGPAPRYGLLTFGLLLVWLGLLWLRSALLAWLGQPASPIGRLLDLAARLSLALLPGLILLWYGAFTPAAPSLANSGVDICQYQVGFCVSGSRSFIFFGAIALLVGGAVSYFMLRGHKAGQA